MSEAIEVRGPPPDTEGRFAGRTGTSKRPPFASFSCPPSSLRRRARSASSPTLRDRPRRTPCGAGAASIGSVPTRRCESQRARPSRCKARRPTLKAGSPAGWGPRSGPPFASFSFKRGGWCSPKREPWSSLQSLKRPNLATTAGASGLEGPLRPSSASPTPSSKNVGSPAMGISFRACRRDASWTNATRLLPEHAGYTVVAPLRGRGGIS